MKILILGGTGEARALADALVGRGHDVTTSLAGRTSEPILPHGRIRVGKFGGVPGLRAYLKAYAVDCLVDATHPYAGLISTNAVAASSAEGIALVRFMRPGWSEPDGANWINVRDMEEAAAALPSNSDVLLTTGHGGLESFLARDDCRFLVRLIEPPALDLPRHARLLLARPPYLFADERALMLREAITHLVTKNSGGAQTEAKLEAARDLGVRVVMVMRPQFGLAHDAETLDEALRAIEG